MQYLYYALMILVSGIIGYITNFLAIKMLFHPYKAHYLFGKIKIPFTPGIVPKNRKRIAASLASMIEENFLSSEVITKELTLNIKNSEMSSVFSDKSIHDLLDENTESGKYEDVRDGVSAHLADYILDKFEQKHYASMITKKLVESISPKLGFFGGVLGSLEPMIEEKISEFVRITAKEEIVKLSNEGIDKLAESNIHDVMRKAKIDEVQFTKHIFGKILSKMVDYSLKKINFKEIIENNLNAMEVKEFEDILIGVIRKELRAITLLGGLLGAILGIVNIFLANLL